METINPETSRKIKVDGATFHRLLQKGYMYDKDTNAVSLIPTSLPLTFGMLSLPDDMFVLIGEKMDYTTIKALAHTSLEFAKRVKELYKEHALSIAPPVKDWFYYRSKAGSNVKLLLKHLQKDGVDAKKYSQLLFGGRTQVMDNYIDQARGDLLLAVLLCGGMSHLSKSSPSFCINIKNQLQKYAEEHNKLELFRAGERMLMFKIPYVYDPSEDDS